MEKVSTIGKGDKAKLKGVLKPLYEIGNKVVCGYQTDENSLEFSFHRDDLIEEYGNMILVKDLIIEEIHDDLVVCRIEGSNQQITLHKEDLEVLEVDGNLIDF